MANDAKTWHYGLVARWWAEFNEEGPEIALFRRYIDEYGDPVLDTGCGTGRLLVPYIESGLKVDGSDASEDMLYWCRKKLQDKGLESNLYAQPMHQLALPNRYQCIVNCGAFGIGGDREQDIEGLKRVYRHLNPGGAFIVDHYLPNFGNKEAWLSWLPGHEGDFPKSFEPDGDRKTAADGTELEICHRYLSFNPLLQTQEREIQVKHYRNGELVTTETSSLVDNIYFMNEIILMLQHVGFVNVRVRSASTNQAPKPWKDSYILFIAEKPSDI
jgi:SAM-dependent methyltransferase